MKDKLVKKRIENFCSAYGGDKIRPLAKAVPLPEIGLSRVREAVPLILTAQRIILKSMLKNLGKDKVLDFFGIPRELSSWITILDDVEFEFPILRVDVIPTNDNKSWICELNVDSSVGGAEASQFLKMEQPESKLEMSHFPYDSLAQLILKYLAKTSATKVCILDWEHWGRYGSFTLDWLKLTLSFALPGVEVFFATEKNGLEKVDKSTLVFRVFLSEDALENLSATAAIFESSAAVICDFSGELLGSKIWLALLHDDSYRCFLNQETLVAIDETIPYTVLVHESNFQALLDAKSEFFFKVASDFGGKGVICGRTASAEEVSNRVGKNLMTRWIAQKACSVKPMPVTRIDNSEPVPSNVVLGLYLIDGHWSGVLVRANANAEIINVAAGSSIGWGYEATVL